MVEDGAKPPIKPQREDMTLRSHEFQILQQLEIRRAAQAGRLDPLFDLHLRAASPAVANAVAAAASAIGRSAPDVVAEAVMAVVGQGGDAWAVAVFDGLRHAARITLRQDALLGQALVAALKDELGNAFGAPTRELWSEGYIRLVETVTEARRNRFDFVA